MRLAFLLTIALACASTTLAQDKIPRIPPRDVGPPYPEGVRNPALRQDGLGAILLGGSGLKTQAIAREEGYWIGISCANADKELLAKLKLKAGVTVLHVFPQSPAAKAGLKEGDVIASANGKPMGKLEQLAQSVGDSKGAMLKLEVVRGGKCQVVVVRPSKRPAEIVIGEDEDEEKEAAIKSTIQKDVKRIEQLRRELVEELDELRQARSKPGLVIRPQARQPGAPRPGAPRPGGAMLRGTFMLGGMGPGTARLPDDMQVTIHKRGNKPVRVIVKQGEKMWRTTENELAMLPAEARVYVARMLGKSPPQFGGAPGLGAAKMEGPGRIRIQIREGDEKEGKPQIRWFELKRPEGGGEEKEKGGAEQKGRAEQNRPAQVSPRNRPAQNSPPNLPELRFRLRRPEVAPASEIEEQLRILEEEVEKLQGEVQQLRRR